MSEEEGEREKESKGIGKGNCSRLSRRHQRLTQDKRSQAQASIGETREKRERETDRQTRETGKRKRLAREEAVAAKL